MADITLETLLHRTGEIDLDLRATTLAALDAYTADPLFCIPAQAREIVARHGAATRIVVLGASSFTAILLDELAGRACIDAVVDDFRAARGEAYAGLPTITSAELVERARDEDILAVSACRYDYSRRYFKTLTRHHGIAHLNFEQAMRLLRPEASNDHRIEDWGRTIAARADEFLALGDVLVDDYSRFTLHSVLLTQLTCNPEWTLHAARPYCTLYFRTGLWSPGTQERFVDCGASLAESTSALIDVTDGRFDRIWMVEPDRFNLETLQKYKDKFAGRPEHDRLHLLPYAVSDAPGTMAFSHQGGHAGMLARDNGAGTAEVRRLDDVIDGEPTLIKMDIEGAELAALRGAQGLIAASRPKLAISAYHRAGDLVDIARFAREVRPDYRVGLRHHTEERWDTCLYFY
ncbi:FkbM family methyltransferase [Xylophilus sp. GOD-11R]|uniref:FkbM family methyltransferase n=1 Tax=Xylophilus sp. GOD-11R TaxID=3089814 RepID=UPI00298BD65C|nr:FkbM family methyltransferase [Xylophilus sp. GOD-11R]WPB57764.1 FkbM family methyltransferase [Xylophilus sp. GOD-11R]